jgi:hypothetical protein
MEGQVGREILGFLSDRLVSDRFLSHLFRTVLAWRGCIRLIRSRRRSVIPGFGIGRSGGGL